MIMKITEAQRKLLTEELLKECWHEWHFAPEDVTPCLKCRSRKDNRTFTDWTDFGAVVEKLRLHTIINFLHKIQATTLIMSTHKPNSASELPERFCILVAEAIKEGERK